MISRRKEGNWMEEPMQEVKGYSDSREEEEGEEIVVATTGEEESSRLQTDELNQTRREGKQLELRLGGGGSEEEEELGQQGVVVVEKEHMFDKVVTPSDVGKLNRLVIPKQHAEKYFPLDSSSNEKGLLLNFEDRNGKLWRFRYSYWNSSQSYVMTKGWSRFVKDKKLDAGDIVSFHRGVGELYRHRLYIDWRPRSHHHCSNSIFTLPYFLPTHNYNNCENARSSLYSSSNPHPYPHPHPHPPHHHFHQHPNYNINNNFYTLYQHQQYPPHPHPHPHHNYYLTSPTPYQQQADRMNIIDSVPIAHHHHPLISAPAAAPAVVTPTTPGKRLRLFGINMECASSSTPHVPLPLPSSTPRFGDPKGETSLHPSSHSRNSSAQ